MASLLASRRPHEAAVELIRINEYRVRGYLRARLGDPDDVDDAFSIFAERTWRGIGSYRQEGTVEAWAFGIARNAARRVRDARRHHRTLALDDEDVHAQGLQHDVRTDELERAALRLEAVRRALPGGDRTLLGLRVDRRMPWREIATVLARQGSRVSSSALRKRFERLKGRMGRIARELERAG